MLTGKNPLTIPYIDMPKGPATCIRGNIMLENCSIAVISWFALSIESIFSAILFSISTDSAALLLKSSSLTKMFF